MAAKTNVRLICYSEEIVNGEPIYVSSNCLPVKASKYEPAGHSFHNAVLQLHGMGEEENADDDVETVASDKESSYMPSSESYKTKGKKKGAEGKEQDHYALLGLAHLRYLATEEQIKKSYRETALKHHPDKLASSLLGEGTEAAKQTKKEEIESHFRAIQEAYEVLMDPVRRRIYDSTDEFDDEIPTDCAPQDFFKVFGPAFMRNGRWSVSQPIPTLGDDNTSIKDVDDFYNFWYSFKSWREFPHDEQFDLEQAESRDHKRWMERQNAKLTEKARKDEYTRIRTLVDNAYKKDPRILRKKEEAKAEKLKKRQAKYLVKKLEEEEAARVVEEQKRQKEEEGKRAAEAASQQKKIREKEKKQLRKERTRLRTLSAPVLSQRLLDITENDVENLCTTLEMEQMKNLCDKIERKAGLDQAKLLKEALGIQNNRAEDQKQDKNPKENGSPQVNGTVPLTKYEKKEKPWGREEIELLRKGIQKYPKGTSRRWEVISEFLGTGRSVEEILKATKTVLLQKPDSAKAFDSFLEKRKPAPSIASPLTTREEVEGVSSSNGLVNNAGGVGTSKEPTSTGSVPKTLETVANAEQGVALSSDQDTWSAVQERALVQALKTFPKDASQRWERVAAAVPGKTVIQCKRKFAQLKESFRSKKSTA